jgi:hypothetical protein
MKITINFDNNASNDIKILQKALGNIELTSVIEQALGLLAYEKIEQGYTITSVKDGVPVKQIIIPFKKK